MTERIEATATLASATVIPPRSPFAPSAKIQIAEHLPAKGRIALKLDESHGGGEIAIDVPAQLARYCSSAGAPTRWRVTIEPEPDLNAIAEGRPLSASAMELKGSRTGLTLAQILGTHMDRHPQGVCRLCDDVYDLRSM